MVKRRDFKDTGQAERIIDDMFRKAERISGKDQEAARKEIKKARRIAMRFNLKLGREKRKRFCRKCYSFFISKNSKKRVKKGYLSVECFCCGNRQHYKIMKN